ncbi:Longin-like domain-containing protein, partial [Lipomyces japonicus]|uniref:Longin-like domain-containing protein n=1 Tax=Lipomyces japonicus TaxID=56871 RepID=UPI0034CEB0FD
MQHVENTSNNISALAPYRLLLFYPDSAKPASPHSLPAMTIYSFWIFDRHCQCTYHRDYKRPGRKLRPGSDKLATGTATVTIPDQPQQQRQQQQQQNALSVEDDSKLVFGVVFSLRNIVSKLAGEKEPFFAFATSKYRLHFLETLTNLRFVMVTDLSVDGSNIRPILEQIYAGLYVEYVVKNPLSPADHSPESYSVDNELFALGLDRFLRPLAIF